MSTLGLVVGLSNLFCAAVAIGLAIPLWRGRIRRNPFYGVRFRDSFVSDEAWYAANAYGARRMILWSVPLVLIGIASFFLASEGRPWVTMGLALAPSIYLVPCLESWRMARRFEREPSPERAGQGRLTGQREGSG